MEPRGPVDKYEAASAFLADVGLKPNKDAIDQLAEAFLPALRIICERDHAGDGSTWKQAGWKAQLHELFKKVDRLNYRDWQRTAIEPGEALKEAPDIINYVGFYFRGRLAGIPAWAKWGRPSE